MKNRFLLLLFFSLIFTCSFSQYDLSKINKKAIDSYNKALQQAEGNNFDAAIKLLKQSIEQDQTYIEAYLSLGGVFGQLKSYQESIQYYEKAFAIDSNYTSDFRLPYSINLAGLGQFDKALTTINNLLSRTDLSANTRKAAEYRKKSFQFAVDFAKAHVADNYVFNPVNLGDGVNTEE